MNRRPLNLLWVGERVPSSLECSGDAHIIGCVPRCSAMASALDSFDGAASSGAPLPTVCVVALDGPMDVWKKTLCHLHTLYPMLPVGALTTRAGHPAALSLLNARVIDRIIPHADLESGIEKHMEALTTHAELLRQLHKRLHDLDRETLFVTGGTGFLGQHFLRYVLRCSTAKVDVLTRGRGGVPFDQRLSTLQELYPERIRCVEGDIGEPGLGLSAKETESLVHRIDAIWHLAAITKFEPILRDVIFETNFTGTRHVVTFAQRLKKLSSFHHVSTAYVAGDPEGDAPLPEAAIPEPASFKNPYEESKYHAEQWVMASGLPAVIYRPSIIMGERVSGLSDGQTIYNVAKMLRLARLTGKRRKNRSLDSIEPTSFRVVVSPDATKNLIPVDEVVSRMLCIGVSQPAPGSFFNLAHTQPTTMTDIISVIASLLNISEYEPVDTLEGETLSAAEALLHRISKVFKPYMLKSDPAFASSAALARARLRHFPVVDRAQLHFFLHSFFEQHFGLDYGSGAPSG